MKTLKSAPPTALLGMLILAAVLVTGVFAPLLAPYGETEIVGVEYEPWSAAFPLGTDNLGRDMLSRMIYGARNTVGLALLTTGIAFTAGAALGMVAALKGGWIDQILSRVIDVLMAVPPLILALMLLAIVGPSIPNMVGVIAVIYIAPVFRLSRAAAMNGGQPGFHPGRPAARGGDVVVVAPRGVAEHLLDSDCRVWLALLLRVSLHCRAQLPWHWHSAAHR